MKKPTPAEDSRTGIQSVEFAMDLLRVLIESAEALSLTALAKRSGMAPSRVHKYLLSLLRVGLVEQTARGQYDIGSLGLELGFAALGRVEVTGIAQDYMDSLCETLKLDCCLAVWTEEGPVIVRRSQSKEPISLYLQLGQRLPITTSANGQIFAAFLGMAKVNELVDAELSGEPRGKQSAADGRASFEALLGKIRHDGLTVVSGTMLTGVNAIACPVFDYRGAMVASLTILGLAHRLPADTECEAAQTLKATAADLSRHLGFRHRTAETSGAIAS